MENEQVLDSSPTDRRARFEAQRSRFDARRRGAAPSPPPSPQCGEGGWRPEEAPSASQAPSLSPGLPVHPFPIAGFSHYDGARALPSLRPGIRLTLRQELANPYDPFAVEILHGVVKLGYVPRFCNRRVGHLLEEDVRMTCEIKRVDPNSPPWEAVLVRLSVST